MCGQNTTNLAAHLVRLPSGHLQVMWYLYSHNLLFFVLRVFTRNPSPVTLPHVRSTKNKLQCIFQAEVQTITTAGGADGSFTLAFGDVDYPLPGTVDVVHGEEYIVTSQDLTPYIKRGDRISAGGWEYAVHAFRSFNATHLYLAKVGQYFSASINPKTVAYVDADVYVHICIRSCISGRWKR